MTTAEEDLALRQASMKWLEERTHDGLLTVDIHALQNEFYFDGIRRPLKNLQRGIHSSRGFGAAWTITTTFSEDKTRRPYDDELGQDGLLRYKWEKEDPSNPGNRALRKARELQLPLIWFWGVAQGLYKAVFPVYLIDEEPSRRQFVVATDGLQNLESAGEEVDDLTKDYRMRLVRNRVHQPVFRERVLRAYAMQCAICGMPRGELLDAAHIIPDKEPDGLAAVPNGVALCKIHHSAYDHNLIGISDSGVVSTRRDVLESSDGPVFEHGLKRIHGQYITVPGRRALRPDVALLARRFDEFVASQELGAFRSDFLLDRVEIDGNAVSDVLRARTI